MTKSKHRVLLMIDDAEVGGGQQHVLLLAQRMKRFDPHVACHGAGYLVDRLKESGIPFHPLEMSNRPGIGSLLSCRRLLRQLKPAIIHTHGGTAGFTGRVASLGIPRRKAVHTYHGLHYLHDLTSVRNKVFRLVDGILLHVTDRIVCVAQSDVDLGIRRGVADKAKTVLIRNGIDTEAFQHNRGERIRKTVIGTVGRLHIQKGHTVLLKAFAAVVKAGRELELRIIGEGELAETLGAEARQLGIADLVDFRGAKQDISTELAEMDVFALPSLWEGLPLALLEAMAAGVPIVATSVDGVREVVTDAQDALLVPPSDVGLLAGAIQRLVEDKALAEKLAASALSRVRRDFSVDRMVGQTESVYEELTEGNG